MKTFKNDALANAVNFAKKNGCNVYTYEKKEFPISWFLVEQIETGGLGAVQCSSFGGLNLHTKHKANYITGTGFDICENIQELNVESLESIFDFAPSWARENELKNIKKYKNFAEYKKSQTLLNYYQI